MSPPGASRREASEHLEGEADTKFSLSLSGSGIRGAWEKVLANAPHFGQEAPLPTLISGDIALAATRRKMARAPARRWLAGNRTAPGCLCSTSQSSSDPPGDEN